MVKLNWNVLRRKHLKLFLGPIIRVNPTTLSTDWENLLSNKANSVGAHAYPSEPYLILHTSLISNGQNLHLLPEKFLWPPEPLLCKHPVQSVRKFMPLDYPSDWGLVYKYSSSLTPQRDYGLCVLHWLLVDGQ